MKSMVKEIKKYPKSKRGTYRVIVCYYDEFGVIKKKEFENQKKAKVISDAEVFALKINTFKSIDVVNDSVEDSFNNKLIFWYKNFKKDTLKRSAQDTFESTINNHIITGFSKKNIYEINAEYIQSFLNKKKLKYSVSTMKKIYSVLSQFYSYLFKSGIIEFNPMSLCDYKIHKSKIKETPVKVFTDDEIYKIKQIVKMKDSFGNYIYKDGHVFNLILNTGVREGEILAIQNKDIDLENKCWIINKQIREVRKRDKNGEFVQGTENILTTPKSKNSIRVIPLNAEAIESIKILRGNQYCPDDFLIHDNTGKYLSENALRKRFKRILNRAGIANKSIHTLRHTYATKLAHGVFNDKTGREEVVPIAIVSRILGHSSIQTTERIYVHNSDAVKFNGIENLVI